MKNLLILLLTCMTCAGHAQTPSPVTLKIGDPAPPMVIEKWLRGPPVDPKDGKVHVIEFWATWCEPCKEGMPHLSNLAAKYRGQVEFAGISVWENGEGQLARVEKFFAHAGDAMTYKVAFSGEGRSAMARTWLDAAGVRGIPSAFIIDKGGRVAWIGLPEQGLEDALKLALQDKLTSAAAAEVDAAYKEMLKGTDEINRQIEAAAKAADVPQLRKLVHQATDLKYSAATSLVPKTYLTIAAANPASAAVFAENILQDYGNAPKVMTAVANAISGAGGSTPSKSDLSLASKALARVAATSEAGADHEFHLSRARLAVKANDYNAAVEAQTDVLKTFQVFVDEVDKFDTSKIERERANAAFIQKAARAQRDTFQKTLDEYKAAAAAARK